MDLSSTFSTFGVGVGFAAALRVRGATGFLAVARLRLTGAFFAGVLTVADAGI